VEIVQPKFGIRIRKLRLDKGLSQLQLAELADLSEDQISNIERGKSWVGEQTFSLLAGALSVPQTSLLDYSENEEFLKQGGFKVRAPRKSAPLIVRRKRQALIQMPLKKQQASLRGRKPRPKK
jgi:transcriptional regulator with XRE-family HTH domain